jgi:O-antigen ligase
MTLLHHVAAPRRQAGVVAGSPRSADATTILAIFVALQLLLPSALVLNYLPLSLSPATSVALGLGALWLCTQLTTTLGAAKGSSPVRTMLVVYVCVLLASYAQAASRYLPPDERKLGDHAMVTAFALIFVGLALCDGVRSRERIYFLLNVVVVCATAVAVVGILQFLFSVDLTTHLRPPGTHFMTDAGTVEIRDGLRRVASTTAHPIEFGVFCAMVLPLAIHLAFRASVTHRRQLGRWSCVGLIAAGLMFSVSRSAILGLTAAAIVLLFGWSAQRRVRMAFAGLGFLIVIKFVAPGLLGAFFGLFKNARNDSSIQWRTHDYATAKELIAQHFWLGRGLGTWYAPKHEVFDNQYLLTLVDSGAIGLAALVGVALSAVYAASRVGLLTCFAKRSLAPVTDRDLALSLSASVVVALATFATFDFQSFPTVSALLFLEVGMAAALLRLVSAEISGEPADPHAII